MVPVASLLVTAKDRQRSRAARSTAAPVAHARVPGTRHGGHLRRLKGLSRHRRGDPTTSDRLDHRERFQSVRGIAQALMNSMKPLPALLLREFLLAYVLPPRSASQLPVPGG